MNRIVAKFRELRQKRRKALIVYLTCGYPSLAVTERLVLEFDKRGVDIIELGVPFSDPLADGPVIQAASEYALSKNKVNLSDIFSLVSRLRKKTQIPICLMTYYNPVFSLGDENFIKRAIHSGVDGVIVPDLPPEEASQLISLGRKDNLATIFFLSPTSPVSRIKLVAAASSGFIYYVSLTGVTGVRKKLPQDLARNILSIKKHTVKPLCVGFGISNAGHIQEVFKVADGAILGSAVIKLIQDNIMRKDLVRILGRFIGTLRKPNAD